MLADFLVSSFRALSCRLHEIEKEMKKNEKKAIPDLLELGQIQGIRKKKWGKMPQKTEIT